jgi:integrase
LGRIKFDMAGKSRRGALRHLELKGQTWWFRREIPRECRPFEGGRRTDKVNLETSDVRLAKSRRDELERETDQRWADMRAGRYVPAARMTPAQRGALWRETLVELREMHPSGKPGASPAIPWDALSPEEQAEIEDDPLQVALDVEEMERERLTGADRRAFDVARLGRVPVDHHLEAYLNAVKLVPASKAERRGQILRFAQWAAKERVRLDGVDRRTAGRYVDSLVAMHPVTRSKHLMALRGYWGYLHIRGLIEGGDKRGAPWTDQEMPDRSGRSDRDEVEPERPFTADEVKTLLTSPWPDRMKVEHRAQVMDSLRLSLLSGLRLGEVVSLRVEDVDDVSIKVRAGKSAAAIRTVPLHPDLVELITRRTLGKASGTPLFDELVGERDPEDACGKRFRRYRERIGVREDIEGVRRSRVNFHSARRWFATSAVHAGCSERHVEDVIGHKAQQVRGVLGAYVPGGASWEQRKAVVASVRLPEGCI